MEGLGLLQLICACTPRTVVITKKPITHPDFFSRDIAFTLNFQRVFSGRNGFSFPPQQFPGNANLPVYAKLKGKCKVGTTLIC